GQHAREPPGRELEVEDAPAGRERAEHEDGERKEREIREDRYRRRDDHDVRPPRGRMERHAAGGHAGRGHLRALLDTERRAPEIRVLVEVGAQIEGYVEALREVREVRVLR